MGDATDVVEVFKIEIFSIFEFCGSLGLLADSSVFFFLFRFQILALLEMIFLPNGA